MDTRTGEVGTLERLARRLTEKQKNQFIKPIELSYLSDRVRALVLKDERAFISRNSRCPCGSGKRFKNCCMFKEVKRDSPLYRRHR